MSNYYKTGFLFGILQRGAHTIGHASPTRRMSSQRGAFEQQTMLNDRTSPAGIDNPGESSFTSSFNGTTHSQSQTNHVVDPQMKQSQSLSSTDAVDASLEKAKPPSIISQADSTHADPSSEQVKPSATTTLSKSSSTVELTETTQGHPQTKLVAQPPTRQSQPHSAAAPEKPRTTATRSDSSSLPDTAVDSFSQTANPSAIQLVTNLLPVTDSVQTKIRPLADQQPSEPRLPRLIVIEQGGKAIVSDNSSFLHEERGVAVSEENQDAFESQHFSGRPAKNRGPSFLPPLSGHVQPIGFNAQVDVPAQANHIAVGRTSASGEVQFEDLPAIRMQAGSNEGIEPLSVLRSSEVQVVQNLSTHSSSRISRPPQLQSGQSVISSVPEEAQEISATGFSVLPAHSERTKVGLAPARTESRAESLRWPGSFPEQTEEQFSRRSPSSQQQRGEPVPKLTINRLDVQIINQPPTPPAPPPAARLTAPAPPGPGPPVDSWEKLERYQLGRLDLIF